MNESKIFFIHIMKTAGTTFRYLLERSLAQKIYPNAEELSKQRNTWYLSNLEFLDQIRKNTFEHKRVICGHYPFIYGKEISNSIFLASFLREPVSRAISMISHFKRTNPKFSDASVSEILRNEKFVKNQIENYQTKIFAINQLDLTSVNSVYLVDQEAYNLAESRMLSLDFLGITEEFEISLKIFSVKTGIQIDYNQNDRYNIGGDLSITDEDRVKIRELVSYDLKLYQVAMNKFKSESELIS